MVKLWLSLAVAAMVALALIIGASIFFSSDREPERPDSIADQESPDQPEPVQTVYDAFEQDERRMESIPKQADTNAAPQTPDTTIETQETATKEPVFKKLTPEQEIEADRIWQYVKSQYKIGTRLMMSPKKAIDSCRDLMKRFPGSEYDFKARRVLADIPEQYHKQHHITNQETDLSIFYP